MDLESRGAGAPRRRGRGGRAGEGWTDGDLGRGRSYRFRDPDGHRFELNRTCERYELPDDRRPAHKVVPARGIAIKRLDHDNVLAADVPANCDLCDALTYRLYLRIELNDGSEAGVWMSATIAAHELSYTRDAHGADGRLHHLAFWVDTREECLRAADIWVDHGIEIEAAPSKHAIAQGFFLYGIEPRGNRVEVTTGGRFVSCPTSRASSGPRPSAPRARRGASRRWSPSTPTARRPSSSAPERAARRPESRPEGGAAMLLPASLVPARLPRRGWPDSASSSQTPAASAELVPARTQLLVCPGGPDERDDIAVSVRPRGDC